ncbi:MAG: hypothetical protein M1834_002025 [Cirrosporium novae-zelandiae]|nr:MAG: hypothetical protein M1834_002025 [Cirrosporium novae-zelandiae]
MNPHQRNKVDISKLTSDEQRLFRLYGKLPNKKDLLQNKLKERKYFDSGDYALSKAGKASDVGVTQIGSQHPLPENIPHLSSSAGSAGPGNGHPGMALPGGVNGVHGGIPSGQVTGGKSASPVKESSFLHRGESIDDQDEQNGQNAKDNKENQQNEKLEESISPPPQREGVPIQWQS